MTKPLPCPFCGETPHCGFPELRHYYIEATYHTFRIRCPHGCAQTEAPTKEHALPIPPGYCAADTAKVMLALLKKYETKEI